MSFKQLKNQERPMVGILGIKKEREKFLWITLRHTWGRKVGFKNQYVSMAFSEWSRIRFKRFMNEEIVNEFAATSTQILYQFSMLFK